MVYEKGFTLIELIAVIIILGILAVSLGSKMNSNSSLVQASRDDIVAALFYAQQTAMARDSSSNPVRVILSTSQIDVTEAGTSLSNGGVAYPLVFNNGVTLDTAGTFNYDKLGRFFDNSATPQPVSPTIILSGHGASAALKIESTGYVHPI